jgi:hypothetical protein
MTPPSLALALCGSTAQAPPRPRADFTGTRVLNRVTVLGDRVERYADVTRWPAYAAGNVSAAHSAATL